VDHDPLVPKPPVGVTRGLIRHRDKAHVGSIETVGVAAVTSGACSDPPLGDGPSSRRSPRS